MPRKTFVAGDVLTAADMNLLAQDSSITNASLDTTAGNIGGSMTSYTPTWTNISNGTKTGAYVQQGKMIWFRATFVVTTSPAVAGDFTVTLPVTAAADQNRTQFFAVFYDNSATRTYTAMVSQNSTTALTITAVLYPGTASTAAYEYSPASNVPFTWAVDDRIEVSGWYEAA